VVHLERPESRNKKGAQLDSEITSVVEAEATQPSARTKVVIKILEIICLETWHL
jgi:hypothetical protein